MFCIVNRVTRRCDFFKSSDSVLNVEYFLSETADEVAVKFTASSIAQGVGLGLYISVFICNYQQQF